MQDILVVVDMQNDFIDGTLGTKEAVAIVPKVEEKIRNFKGTVLLHEILMNMVSGYSGGKETSSTTLHPEYRRMADQK